MAGIKIRGFCNQEAIKQVSRGLHTTCSIRSGPVVLIEWSGVQVLPANKALHVGSKQNNMQTANWLDCKALVTQTSTTDRVRVSQTRALPSLCTTFVYFACPRQSFASGQRAAALLHWRECPSDVCSVASASAYLRTVAPAGLPASSSSPTARASSLVTRPA